MVCLVAGCAVTMPESCVSQVTHATLTPDEWFLFFPTTYPEGVWETEGRQVEEIWIEAEDETRLHAWYFPAPEPKHVLLFAHGNAGHLAHRGSLMEYLRDEYQVSVMVFDYRGYGRSEGVPTVAGILLDGAAARKKLAEVAGVEVEEIVLMGRSIGGAVVTQLASQTPPRAMILESTFASFKELAAFHMPRLAWLVPKDKLDSAAAIATYPGPLFQSHGDADDTIPFAMGKRLFESAPGRSEFVVIPGADHNDGQGTEYYARLGGFLDSLDG
jgi:fermentation-respiration switch protein FrsA (DUF1100 family)